MFVSIHAPAWGATGGRCQRPSRSTVSIHAPAWGATSAGPPSFGRAEFRSTPPRGGRPPIALDTALIGHERFDPRPRVGGDRSSADRPRADRRFRSTPPRGGRLVANEYRLNPLTFRSTPPRGGRPGQASEGLVLEQFRSTPPRGGRPAGRVSRASSRRFDPRPRVGGDFMPRSTPPGLARFDPRPRVGGDQAVGFVCARRVVSIHAPAWGATSPISTGCGSYAGFDPRPRVGGDSHRLSSDGFIDCFDPRPRVGGDFLKDFPSHLTTVSIHAPAWGATRRCRGCGPSRACFDPRPRVGGDGHVSMSFGLLHPFRSTPPRGGRPTATASAAGLVVSIHAPAWGATRQHPE